MMRYSNLLASKLPATPSTTPPLGQTINMMAKSSAASSASASSAALATAPLPTAPLPTPAVTLKEQRAFLNQILYLKKGSAAAIQALHEEYLASNMEAKKSMVSKWISSGKNVSVLVKEEQNTLQKLEEAGRVGYLKPGQVAEKMGIKIEYFPNSKEFKAKPKRECIYIYIY